MITSAEIEVTEQDINQSYNDKGYTPLERAVARGLKIDLHRIEVKHDKVYVWMYDDSDYMLYKYTDEESYVKVYDFLNEWELVVEGYTDEDGALRFEGDLISFKIEVDDDTRTHSNNWHGASLDFSGFADEPDSHKKDLKFRLTDDEY
tara:strand:- start:29 stop:472 length:444 start_codon:yes stop_codon:yes gene_type:complete